MMAFESPAHFLEFADDAAERADLGNFSQAVVPGRPRARELLNTVLYSVVGRRRCPRYSAC